MNLQAIADAWISSRAFKTIPSDLDSGTHHAIEIILRSPTDRRYWNLLERIGPEATSKVFKLVTQGASWDKKIPALPPSGRKLAPLEPNAFLAWVWEHGDREKGTEPLTVEDFWYDLAQYDQELTLEEVRRNFLRCAALCRRSQRLGLDWWSDEQGVNWKVAS